MTRVSENSNAVAMKFAIGKTKSKVEDLQIKGSNLKRIQRPSDDPLGNLDLMRFRSIETDTKQYQRNANFAMTLLNYSETALKDLTDIMVRAKELAVQQSSDFFNGEARRNVSHEINQLRNQSLAIANKRFGNRYLFGGYNTLDAPFSQEGNYTGDKGTIYLEISKDFFLPTNINGYEVFFNHKSSKFEANDPLDKFPDEVKPENLKGTVKPFSENEKKEQQEIQSRSLASADLPEPVNHELNNETVQRIPKKEETIFDLLQMFGDALKTNNSTVIQQILPRFDTAIDRLITIRTRIGAITTSLERSQNQLVETDLANAEFKNKIEDADVAELFSDLSRYQNILRTSYKASSTLLNQSLLDFLR